MESHARGIPEPDVLILKIGGALDAVSVAEVRSAMNTAVAQGYRKIVIDLSTLRLIDAAGVGAIVWLYRRLCAQQGWVQVTGARDQPLAILRLLGFDKQLLRAAAGSS